MIGKGYVVEDDLMGIARRIRAIDPSYFVFYSYEKRRYEVYCADDLAVAAVVLPFDRLDERSVRKVLETRRENRKKLLESIERENRLLQKCIDTGISGIVLFPQDQPFFSEQLLYLLLQKYPLVLIDRNLPRLDTSYVIGDNKTGGALCLRHLHALGHQRICFVSSARRNTFTVRSRIDGILQEAEARNIPESSITIWDFFNKHQPYVHYQKQMMKLIREERITAFIAAESTTCAYLYSLFATMNLRVPEDISLMSFDKPLVESQRPDFFTHISQSEYLMGKEAGTILKHQIETRDPQVTHRVMSPLLEVRKSTRAIVL